MIPLSINHAFSTGKRGENQCLLAPMVTPCQGERLSSESRVPLTKRTLGRTATASVAEGSGASAILVVRTARLLMDIEAGHWGISPAPWRGDWLEAKLAMGGLSPALTGAGTIFVVQQVDRWGRDHFVYETARYARTVRAVPVALDDHCAAAARTKSRWKGLHSHSPFGTQRA